MSENHGQSSGTSMMSRRSLDTAALTATIALTRFVFRSHYLYDVDSVNFALALKRFDPTVHQPHPPGYFLYVYLGRLVNFLFQDANTALVAFSIVFSCAAGLMIYILTDSWFARNAAVFAGLIFVFSPLAWFHGTVALIYIVEAFFSVLTGYLCWRVYLGTASFAIPAAVVVGIAAGFRPSSLLLLCPLLLFSFGKVKRRNAAGGVACLVLTLFAWLIPMLRSTGGEAYFAALESLWLAVPSKGMAFNSSLMNSFVRALVIVGIYLLCFGCAAILPVTGFRANPSIDRRKAIFTRVWIAPGLLFFTLVYLKFVNSGYLLALVPPVCVWMGLWASTWYKTLRLRPALKLLLVGACAAANTLIFLCAPVYCSYRSVRQFEMELRSIVEVLPRIASPRDTMIVGFDSHFLGYRHAGFYLPGYLTVQFPEVHLTSGTWAFAMQARNTWLENRPPPNAIHNFIIFPLPLGDNEYSDYMALVRKRFPPGELRTVIRGGHGFTTGSVADLQVLFPDFAPLVPSVGTNQDSRRNIVNSR